MRLLILVILIIFFNCCISKGKDENNPEEKIKQMGVIIANEVKTNELFTLSDEKDVIKTAEKISKQYKNIIIHLGRGSVFKRGNLFYTENNKKKLKYFCDTVYKNNSKVIFWILDSYGSEDFNIIYNNYKQYMNENKIVLEKENYKYEGIVLDLEWINLKNGKLSENNNDKLLEIVKELSIKFKEKELFMFSSLVEDKDENIKRGHNESELLKYIDNFFVMLYPKDAGFYKKENELLPYLNKNRIESLKEYYKANKYETVISIDSGYVLERNDKFYFIKSSKMDYLSNDKNFDIEYKKEYEFYNISCYKVIGENKFKRNDSFLDNLFIGEKIYFFKVKDNLLGTNDYLWEYFLLED